MTCKRGYDISKIWLRFSKNINNVKKIVFRWEQLPKDRFEEFIDFKMKHFVKHEITHVAAGIYKSPEAMAEYKEIMVNKCKNPSYYPSICCVDDETNKMVAADGLVLYRRGEIYKDTLQAQTAEVKKFYKILHEWNNLCPVPDILIKYNVDKYFDDGDCTVHPDYRGFKITTSISLLRQMVCMANAVPLTGGWMTHIGTQRTTRREGWETIYQISCDQLEKKLGIKFQNAPPTFTYSIKSID